MYIVLPILIYLATKINKRTFFIISVVVCGIFLIDEVYNGFIARVLNLPTSNELYYSWGWKLELIGK
jgi:preprotein translocase subunit SecB